MLFDIVILTVFSISCIVGLARGLLKEFVATIGLFFIAINSYIFGGIFIKYLDFLPLLMAKILSGFFVVVISTIIALMFNRFICFYFAKYRASFIDKFLGLPFGAFKGYFISALIYACILIAYPVVNSEEVILALNSDKVDFTKNIDDIGLDDDSEFGGDILNMFDKRGDADRDKHNLHASDDYENQNNDSKAGDEKRSEDSKEGDKLILALPDFVKNSYSYKFFACIDVFLHEKVGAKKILLIQDKIKDEFSEIVNSSIKSKKNNDTDMMS